MHENVNIKFIVVWQNICKQIVWKGCKIKKWTPPPPPKKKQEEIVSFGNVATNFVNSDSCCFVFFCLKTGNETERFYKCAVSAKVALTVWKTAKENILIKVIQK